MSIGVAVFHILPNTQRGVKVKWRKGKRASVLVEFRSARLWSIFERGVFSEEKKFEPVF